MTQAEVELKWIADRSRLLTCGSRHAAVVEFYRARDEGITNTKGTDAPPQ